MAQAREGVELGVEGNGAPLAIGKLGAEGGAEVVGAAGDLEALLFEVVGEDLVRVDLLVGNLGVLPDLYGALVSIRGQVDCPWGRQARVCRLRSGGHVSRSLTSLLIVFRPSFRSSMAAKTWSANSWPLA